MEMILRWCYKIYVYMYLPVIFECPHNLPNKNLYSNEAENIILTKKAIASELENCFVVFVCVKLYMKCVLFWWLYISC